MSEKWDSMGKFEIRMSFPKYGKINGLTMLNNLFTYTKPNGTIEPIRITLVMRYDCGTNTICVKSQKPWNTWKHWCWAWNIGYLASLWNGRTIPKITIKGIVEAGLCEINNKFVCSAQKNVCSGGAANRKENRCSPIPPFPFTNTEIFKHPKHYLYRFP